MIPDLWYAVLDSRELPRNRPVGLVRLGEKLVLWRRQDGEIACLRDRCAHRGAALSGGELCEGGRIACPFHGFQYDETGRCRLLPAAGRAAPVPRRMRARSYPAREAHGFVWIFNGLAKEPMPEIPFFDDLSGLGYASMASRWSVHYSRAIENQLDAMHLPFVHRTTIGRGGRTVVDGPVVRWLDPDRLRFFVVNRPDDGETVARKAEEVGEDEARVHLDFQFPNLWQNHLSDKLRIVAAFAPVDEENTIIYLRMYQGIVRVPLLREAFCWLMMRFNRVVLDQDRHVVLTQRPTKTALRMEENLVEGDRPIAEYRRRRDALQRAAATAGDG